MTGSKRVFYVVPHAPVGFVDALSDRAGYRLDAIDPRAPDSDAAPILADAHAYQIGSTRDELDRTYHVTSEFLVRTPNLLVVSTAGAGYDTVDTKACTQAGVLVINQSGGNKEAVAEHVLGMLLCLSKRIVEIDRVMRRKPGIDRNAYMGHDVTGRTIGIVGLGHVGRRVAELCRGLFGMRVLAYDPYLSEAAIQACHAEKVELDDLLRRADFVSLNCPLTDETRSLVGAREYALMQPHAFFITTARGFIHDEAALVEALKSGQIAGAGLDVWAKEPPPPDHPLLQFDNVVVSAHSAGVTVEARTRMGTLALEGLQDALEGRRPARIINPEVWPRFAERLAAASGL